MTDSAMPGTRHEYRALGLPLALTPAAGARPTPSLLGYSVGEWQGDTLVVKTMGSSWRHFDTVGIGLSLDAEIIESFTVSEDGRRLDYRLEVIDPWLPCDVAIRLPRQP